MCNIYASCSVFCDYRAHYCSRILTDVLRVNALTRTEANVIKGNNLKSYGSCRLFFTWLGLDWVVVIFAKFVIVIFLIVNTRSAVGGKIAPAWVCVIKKVLSRIGRSCFMTYPEIGYKIQQSDRRSLHWKFLSMSSDTHELC